MYLLDLAEEHRFVQTLQSKAMNSVSTVDIAVRRCFREKHNIPAPPKVGLILTPEAGHLLASVVSESACEFVTS